MITGEGIALRVPSYDDRQRWLETYLDPMQLAYGTPTIVKVPTTLEELNPRVDEARAALADLRPGTFVVVEEDAPDLMLGTIAWRFDTPPPLKVVDIGYGIHVDARRRGLAARATRLIFRWLTEDPSGPHVARVQLDHSVENPASCRVALAAGFAVEGVRRGLLPLPDAEAPDGVRRHDVCLHGRLPSDPPPLRP